jgi:hypothetical protein
MIPAFMALLLFADIGIPMIALTLPTMLILLLPIVVIEAFLCKKWLGLTTWEAMKSNAVANLVSTLLGIPLAWGVMLAVEFAGALAMRGAAMENTKSPIAGAVFFILSAAWVGDEGAWVIPGAVLVLLIPFFFASYWLEYLVINHMLGMPEGDPSNRTSRRIRRAVRNANLVTYGIMIIGTSIWLITSLRHK